MRMAFYLHSIDLALSSNQAYQKTAKKSTDNAEERPNSFKTFGRSSWYSRHGGIIVCRSNLL